MNNLHQALCVATHWVLPLVLHMHIVHFEAVIGLLRNVMERNFSTTARFFSCSLKIKNKLE